MSIVMVQSLPAGAALRLFLEPPPGSISWRVLRREDDAFAGPDDAGAARVLDTHGQLNFVDTHFLANGKTYFYRLYCLIDGDWADCGGATGVPAYAADDEGVDVLSFVQDRLDVGLNAYVAAGKIAHARERIAVLSAPPAFDDTYWPVVTVHLGDDASGERGLGEVIDLDSRMDEDGMVTEREGWLARWSLTIVAWSLNPDERLLLRRYIRSIVIANLPVFESEGIQQVDLSQTDTEDFESFDAPVYQCITTFRCLAPAVASNKILGIKTITMSIDPKPRQAAGFGRPYPNFNSVYI